MVKNLILEETINIPSFYADQSIAVKLFLQLSEKNDFLFVLVVEKKETLFRGNTLTTKLIDQYMKMVAIPYLQRTIKDVVMKIMECKQSCEVTYINKIIVVLFLVIASDYL